MDAASLIRTLRSLRADFGDYIREVRMVNLGPDGRVYMALVRPGAADPTRSGSAPFSGEGVRNDIVVDAAAVADGHSEAWRMLLLDHEYFHARHLARATSLPQPRPGQPELQRHFYEAAAWGFNVGEARDGHYPGLRPDEFREALDRYGEHYAALDALMKRQPRELVESFAHLVRLPSDLVTTIAPRLSAERSRPSDPDPSPTTP